MGNLCCKHKGGDSAQPSPTTAATNTGARDGHTEGSLTAATKDGARTGKTKTPNDLAARTEQNKKDLQNRSHPEQSSNLSV